MPNFDENNVRTIEFEAPLSADSASAAKKHFSIDLSLELERQLDMESFPPTPAHYMDTHSKTNSISKMSTHDSLDPHILAHIVKQLQQSLADVTKDRDELRGLIALSHSHEAELQDALQHMIDKATKMEIELSDARKKIKDDEEAITLLRTKVEESRRGLMRLQTENRRQSLAPVDVTRAGVPSFGSPPSSKRASFSPLTGSLTARPTLGHRRIASVSDSPTNSSFLDKSPGAQALSFSDSLTSPSSNPSGNFRRNSGLYGRTSPSQPDDIVNTELEMLRKELRLVKDELQQTKHELWESNEAKEASETCVQALRDFIGGNDAGASESEASSVSFVKSPPLPITAQDDGELEDKKIGGAMTWGFGKLWGDSTSKASPGVPQSATIEPPPTFPSPQMPLSANPLSRKLGGFFSSRSSSISSLTSSRILPLHTNTAPSMQESIYSASDSSSVIEPASPQNDYNTHVTVRDVTNSSNSSNGNSPDLGKEIRIHVPPQHQISAP